MYCRNCGKEIDDEAVICVHCGIATNYQQPIVAQPIVEPPKKKVNVIGIVGFCISIVALGLHNILFFSSSVGLMLYLFFASIISLILCIIGVTQMKKSRLNGFAIAGLVLSIIPLAIALVGWLWIGIAILGLVVSG